MSNNQYPPGVRTAQKGLTGASPAGRTPALNRRLRRNTPGLALSLLLAAAAARAETVVLEQGANGYSGTADTSLYQDRPDNANGGHPYFYVGRTQGASLRRALLRFDLGTAIPAGSTVTGAELRLVVDQSRPGSEPHSLHRAARMWGEGSVNSTDPGGLGAPAAAGDATWNSARHGQEVWTASGADFSPTISAQALAGTYGATVLFTGPGLIQDLQSWVDNPSGNHGWVLRGNESGIHNARRFDSSEGTAGERPRLTVTYTPPSCVEEWRRYEEDPR